MNSERPWYKMKRYIIPLGLAATGILTSAFSEPTPQPIKSNSVVQSVQQKNIPLRSINDESPAVEKSVPSPYQTTELSNNNYYTNTRGNTVHSPAYAPSQPSGASARCRDGTYSFSQSSRGTCSHHGGVDDWY